MIARESSRSFDMVNKINVSPWPAVIKDPKLPRSLKLHSILRSQRRQKLRPRPLLKSRPNLKSPKTRRRRLMPLKNHVKNSLVVFFLKGKKGNKGQKKGPQFLLHRKGQRKWKSGKRTVHVGIVLWRFLRRGRLLGLLWY